MVGRDTLMVGRRGPASCADCGPAGGVIVVSNSGETKDVSNRRGSSGAGCTAVEAGGAVSGCDAGPRDPTGPPLDVPAGREPPLGAPTIDVLVVAVPVELDVVGVVVVEVDADDVVVETRRGSVVDVVDVVVVVVVVGQLVGTGSPQGTGSAAA
jgi:hypothetical protein